MVKYYGRARTRTGSVNTTQLGLKMSGCPSKVGLSGQNNRYIQQRVSCMRGICGIPIVNGAIWRYSLRNKHPWCAEPSQKCLAAAGGIGNINTPYYKIPQAGKKGCGYRPPASGDIHRTFPDGLKLTVAAGGLNIWESTLDGFMSAALTTWCISPAYPGHGKRVGSLKPLTYNTIEFYGVLNIGGQFTIFLSNNQQKLPFNTLIIKDSTGAVQNRLSAANFKRGLFPGGGMSSWSLPLTVRIALVPTKSYTLQFI